MSDVAFFLPAFRESSMMNERIGSEGNVWLYSFTHEGFTFHALDLFLLLDLNGFFGQAGNGFSEKDKALAAMYGRYFANFIKTGNPNDPVTDIFGEVCVRIWQD